MTRNVDPPQLADVLIIELPQHQPPRHEQTGYRPAVVVGLPEPLGHSRFPMLVVAPMTTQIGDWARSASTLYPYFTAGTAGLRFDSVALLDHVRGVDARRVVRRLGRLEGEEFTAIRVGLARIMGLRA